MFNADCDVPLQITNSVITKHKKIATLPNIVAHFVDRSEKKSVLLIKFEHRSWYLRGIESEEQPITVASNGFSWGEKGKSAKLSYFIKFIHAKSCKILFSESGLNEEGYKFYTILSFPLCKSPTLRVNLAYFACKTASAASAAIMSLRATDSRWAAAFLSKLCILV